MVEYIKMMPIDIQEKIFIDYYKRHVLSEMGNRYFPHLDGVKSDKEFISFKSKCIIKYNEACIEDFTFTSVNSRRIGVLMKTNLLSADKYTSFISIINAITENEVILGMFFNNDFFMNTLYNKLNNDLFKNLITPYYYILLFNEIPKNNINRGCY